MRLRAAAVQTTATHDRDANLDAAETLVRAAACDGAAFVVLPELFNCMGPPAVLRANAEDLDGPTCRWASSLARDLGVHLLAGSIAERIPDAEKIHNTSCLYGPDGTRLAAYRKIHLFDNDVAGAAYVESATVDAGSEVVSADMAGIRLGLATCYDLRFPELFRILALGGATVIALPSMFTTATGRDHWEPLLRARAIENQVFVVAADQWDTRAGSDIRAYGRSMIIDPWGTVLAQAPDSAGYVVADCDLERLGEVRRRLPSLANRRPATYAWPR